MSDTNRNRSNLVPKVHPATRAVEPEDPMTLNATSVPGDPEVMLRCVIQEYARMGWDAPAILGLFRDPLYPALHALLDWYGEPRLRERLHAELARIGVLRFAATVRDEIEPTEDEHAAVPRLVQIDLPHRSSGDEPRTATGPSAIQAPGAAVVQPR
jgi:hypothetical protein